MVRESAPAVRRRALCRVGLRKTSNQPDKTGEPEASGVFMAVPELLATSLCMAGFPLAAQMISRMLSPGFAT